MTQQTPRTMIEFEWVRADRCRRVGLFRILPHPMMTG